MYTFMLHILYKSILCLFIIAPLYVAKVNARDSSGRKELSYLLSTEIDTLRIHKLILQEYNEEYISKNGNPDSALAVLRQTLWESRKGNYTLGMIYSLMASTYIYLDKSAYIQSMRSAREALKLCKGPYEEFACEFYNQAGGNYMIIGNYSEAAINYYYAIKIAKKVQHRNKRIYLTPIYMNLSELWKRIGNKGKSLFYLNEAERNATQNDSIFLPEIIVTRAIAFEENLDTAKALLLKAQQISKIKKLRDEIRFNLDANTLLIYYYIQKKDIKNADVHLERLTAAYRKAPYSVDGEIRYLLTLASIKKIMKRYTEAKADLLSALKLAEQLNSPYLRVEAYKHASDFYADRKNFDKAYRYRVLSEKIKSAVVSEAKAKEIMFLEQKHQLMQKDMELALQKLETLSVKKQTFQQKATIFFILLITTGLFVFFIVYRKNLKQKIRLHQQDLKNIEKEKDTSLLQSIIHSEEEERKRVAMELHDGISSMLSVVKLNLNTISKKYAITSNEHFEEALRLLDTTAEDVRNTSHSLLPDILLHEGLTKALNLYCKRNYKKTDLTFQDYGSPLPLQADKEKHIFRIIQLIIETLVHHQIGRSYLVQLNWHENALFITIDMEGDAFLPQQDSQLDHAWQQVVARTENIGGNIEYASSRPGITAINIDFDL